TQNARPGSSGVMTIKPLPGGTLVAFKLRGGYPNTVYTIWTVYNGLVVPLPTEGTKVPSTDPPADFPPEGNGVAPLARLDKPFTDGMGLDPGMTFRSEEHTSELQSRFDLVCRLLLEKKNIRIHTV